MSTDEKGRQHGGHDTPSSSFATSPSGSAPKATLLAVDDCTVKVGKGEFICVVGPSGCGKSTLMTIAGLEKPTHGEVLVEGRPAGPPGPKRCVVFQKFALFPSETVAQNIKFGLQMARVDAAEQERRLAEQLRIMGLNSSATPIEPALRRHAAARGDRPRAGDAAKFC